MQDVMFPISSLNPRDNSRDGALKSLDIRLPLFAQKQWDR